MFEPGKGFQHNLSSTIAFRFESNFYDIHSVPKLMGELMGTSCTIGWKALSK